jgi:hypothetical protein
LIRVVSLPKFDLPLCTVLDELSCPQASASISLGIYMGSIPKTFETSVPARSDKSKTTGRHVNRSKERTLRTAKAQSGSCRSFLAELHLERSAVWEMQREIDVLMLHRHRKRNKCTNRKSGAANSQVQTVIHQTSLTRHRSVDEWRNDDALRIKVLRSGCRS